MKLNPRDAAIVLVAVDAVHDAMRRKDRNICLYTPEGFSAGDDVFRKAVVEELGKRGRIERMYEQ